MRRFLSSFVLLVLACPALPASQPEERVQESILPSLSYGSACWTSVDLHNLGNRMVSVELEAHRASGALVALVDHPGVIFSLRPGEHVKYRLEIQEETGDAWVRVRETIPSPRLWPVVAVAGSTECVVDNQLRTTSREVAYSMRNPWFAANVSEMPGNFMAVANTSDAPAKVSLCYSAGNLYSVPLGNQTAPQLTPICSNALDVQIPPFGARQFPVERDGSTYFSLRTEGRAIVLQMLRPLSTGVKIYSVDSTIRFEQ